MPCILKSSVSIYLIHHQLILAQLEEWEGDLQNALHSQMSERIESSSRNVFFNFLFDFQILYFLPFFSSSGSRAMTREAVEERAEGFPRSSHFSHVENSQKKISENLLFGSGLLLTPIKMFMRYFCSWRIAIIYSTLKQSPEQTKGAANNWATRKHLNQLSDNLLRTNL